MSAPTIHHGGQWSAIAWASYVDAYGDTRTRPTAYAAAVVDYAAHIADGDHLLITSKGGKVVEVEITGEIDARIIPNAQWHTDGIMRRYHFLNVRPGSEPHIPTAAPGGHHANR